MTDLRLYENDYLFDTAGAVDFESVARSLPGAVTRGSTLIVDGRPQLKRSPKISCPRCGRNMEPGRTTLVFRHAPPRTRKQRVHAWVCRCGETYIPGTIAREAYRRAFPGEAFDASWAQVVSDFELVVNESAAELWHAAEKLT